jgi:hypothetical protein
MPYMFRGIMGTDFCGQRDFREDGSYLTTEWIICILPVIPIRSLRVLGCYRLPGFWEFPKYLVTEVGPYCRKQVLSVYAFLFLLLPLPILILRFLEPILAAVGLVASVVLFVTACVIPAVVPGLLRRRARRRLLPCPSPRTDSPCETISSIHIP